MPCILCVVDEPVSAPVEIKAQEVLSPVDRPSLEVTFTPSPVVLPSIISFPSPILPAPALDLTPAPLPVTPHIPDPPSPPTKGQEVQAHQRGITSSPPKTNLCSVSQSQPPTLGIIIVLDVYVDDFNSFLTQICKVYKHCVRNFTPHVTVIGLKVHCFYKIFGFWLLFYLWMSRLTYGYNLL